MNLKYCLISIIFLLSCSISTTNAQVTMGSNIPPAQGALLDLKEDGPTKKGLGMPRVWLEELNDLKPCVNNQTVQDKAIHTGLLVYNVNEELCAGLHVWDGDFWTPLIPCPDPTLEFKFYKETALASGIYDLISPNLESNINLAIETTISSVSGLGIYWKNDLNLYSSTYLPGRYIFSHMSPDPISIVQKTGNNILSLYYNYNTLPLAEVTIRYYYGQSALPSYLLGTITSLDQIGRVFSENDINTSIYLPVGYKFDRIDPTTLVIGANPSNNVINVFYVPMEF